MARVLFVHEARSAGTTPGERVHPVVVEA